MRKKKVKTNYDNLRLDELHTLSGTILDCMRDSEVFTDLPFEIEELEAIVQDFQVKWQTAKNGGSKWDKAIKDEAKVLLRETLSKLGHYVNQTAKGNLPILLSSGLLLEADSKPLSPPDIPQLVALTDGIQSGQINIRFKPVKKCWMYEYQYAEALDEGGEPLWGEVLVTRNSKNNVIAPTVRGNFYYARVRSRNGVGVSEWSIVVSLLAR